MTSDVSKAPEFNRVVDWCRRDRGGSLLPLAAAAGDPIALAAIGSRLTWPHLSANQAADIEILAAHRISHLCELASRWPDITELPDEALVVEMWQSALRHLARQDVVNVDAVTEGPLRAEALLVFAELRSDLGPVSWDSYCHRVQTGRYSLSDHRAIACYGFAESTLDVSELSSTSRTSLRALRGSWDRVDGLRPLINDTDIDRLDDPIELAVWWEAAQAADLQDALVDSFGDRLISRLQGDAEPARWWPAVLAALTDWVVP